MKILSVCFSVIWLTIALHNPLSAQSNDPSQAKSQPSVISTGMALYWHTLSSGEKNAYLTGYFMSHYEVLRKFEQLKSPGNDHVENITSEMKQTVAYFKINSYDERQRIIELIDQYYKRKARSSNSFANALQNAHRILQYEKSHSVPAQ